MTINARTRELIESYLTSLNCPRSLTVLILFRNKEYEQLVNLDIFPDNYLDPKAFRDAFLATEFLSCNDFLSTNIDKKAVAIRKFIACEAACKEVNKDAFRSASIKLQKFEWLHNEARQIIRRILYSPLTADEFFDSANWGPGNTVDIRGDTSSTNKFRNECGITRELFNFIEPLFPKAYPNWSPNFKIRKGNKVVTVPKNAKTDRVIAIEPGFNLWFQKAIGNAIRIRLRRFGYDLSDASYNQHAARIGSIYNNLATVDFSSASDTISISTVQELLPERWFELMDICRSKFGEVDGSLIRYEKFSSMGNAFTFELESLIFLSLALSVCHYLKLPTDKVSVFGDDVILPKNAFNLFQELCSIYGFTVNPKKSYSSSAFRESCGSYFFLGVDCKPYYLDKVVRRLSEVYVAANSVRLVSRLFYGCDSRFRDCYYNLVGSIDPKDRFYIPIGYVNGGFISNFDEACPFRNRHGIEGYRTRVLITVPLGIWSDDHALLLARLKAAPVRAPDTNLALGLRMLNDKLISQRLSLLGYGNISFVRARVKYIRSTLSVSQWPDIGPWID